MQLGDHEKNGNDDSHWAAVGPALMAAGVMLIGCFVAFLLMNLESLRPGVGDIVVYRSSVQQQDVWQLQVSKYRATSHDSDICVMDPAVMAEEGGSLVVEARDDASLEAPYRLHWAGAHTAHGAGDCSGSADLEVSRTDLQKLANAAGGFGVDHGRLIR
jgi:hypothetical protein